MKRTKTNTTISRQTLSNQRKKYHANCHRIFIFLLSLGYFKTTCPSRFHPDGPTNASVCLDVISATCRFLCAYKSSLDPLTHTIKIKQFQVLCLLLFIKIPYHYSSNYTQYYTSNIMYKENRQSPEVFTFPIHFVCKPHFPRQQTLF